MTLMPPKRFDLEAWMAANPSALQAFDGSYKTSKKSKPKNPNKTKDAYSLARAWISHVKPAISGQGGSPHTFGVAYTLLKGFCLSISEAMTLLAEWNMTCVPPWTQQELEAKILAAEQSPDEQPRGYKLPKKVSAFQNMYDQIQENELVRLVTPRTHSGILDDPASIAIRFVDHYKTDIGLCRYRWWNGQFFQWNEKCYAFMSKEEIDSIIFWFIEDTFIKKYADDCANCDPDKVDQIKKRKVTNSLVNNVKTGIISVMQIQNEGQSEPFWLVKPAGGWSADEMIPTANKLIHLPSFVANLSPHSIDKTPKYFSTYTLKYDFDFDSYDGPVSPPPVWRLFLESIFPGDQESIDTLQEFYGYFLTPSTRLEKMLMLIGQKRSGKGTIMRTIKHLLGEDNVCFPTFKMITSQFGKQSLIGKTLAMFPDARITGRTDTGDVVETLLSIVGEDAQTIDRKHMSHVTKRLTTRFIISSNELPRLTENSGALVSRAIILKFDQTFLGNEDVELEEKLMPEIPDILRWAIDGWYRLSLRKKFLQPASGQEIVNEFLNLTSPISHFLQDCVDISPAYEDNINTVFNMWKNWCEHQNRDNVGDKDNFTRNLRASVSSISFGPPTSGNGSTWGQIIRGLRLKPESSDHANGHANGHTSTFSNIQDEFDPSYYGYRDP